MPSASAAQSALIVLAVLVALAAAGCNGFNLYEVQRAMDAVRPHHLADGVDTASQVSDADHLLSSLTRQRILLIAAEGWTLALVTYVLLFHLIRRVNEHNPFVAVRVDVLLLLVLGGGGAAIGVLMFLGRSWIAGPGQGLVSVQAFSIAHCTSLGVKRCALHFAGGVGILLTAAILFVTALFELVYKCTHHGGAAAWRESIKTLSSDLGSEAPSRSKSTSTKKKRTRSKILSISDPLEKASVSSDAAPLISTLNFTTSSGAGARAGAAGMCSTNPYKEDNPYHFKNSFYEPASAYDYDPFGPPRPAPVPELGMGMSVASTSGGSLPLSPSMGSVSTLATTPLFGLAPAYIAAPRRTSSHEASTSRDYLPPTLSPSPSQVAYGGRLHHSPSQTSQTGRLYHSPSQNSTRSTLAHKSSGQKLRAPEMPVVREDTARPKLSMEQLERKRTLFAEGTL